MTVYTLHTHTYNVAHVVYVYVSSRNDVFRFSVDLRPSHIQHTIISITAIAPPHRQLNERAKRKTKLNRENGKKTEIELNVRDAAMRQSHYLVSIGIGFGGLVGWLV